MPPDNQLPPHHAPTGLKLWLTVFGVVLVIALSFLVWAQNTAPDTTDDSAVVTKEITTDETATWKTYTNTMFGFKLKYPTDWKIDSSTLDESSSPAQGFSSGRVYVQIYQGPEDEMTKKIELAIYSTEATSLDNEIQLITEPAKYTETSRKTFNQIVWSIGKTDLYGSGTNMGAVAHAWTRKSYTDVSNDKIGISATGYHFTGVESSEFTEEMAILLEQTIGTFDFIKQ